MHTVHLIPSLLNSVDKSSKKEHSWAFSENILGKKHKNDIYIHIQSILLLLIYEGGGIEGVC